jgi:hypothetical protein
MQCEGVCHGSCLEAEGPAALAAPRAPCPSPNQVAQRLRRAGRATARPRRVPEEQLKLAPGQNGLGAAGRYRRGTIKAATQLRGRAARKCENEQKTLNDYKFGSL